MAENEIGTDERGITQRSARPAMMTNAAAFDLQKHNDRQSLVLHGDWITMRLNDAAERLRRDAAGLSVDVAIDIDVEDLGRLDTAGAYAIIRALGRNRTINLPSSLRPDLATLVDLISPALQKAPRVGPRVGGVRQIFERIGRAMVEMGDTVYRDQAFFGQLVASLGRTIVRPRRLRITPLVATIEQAGLGGLPIAVVMTFFIGAVLALVGSTMLQSLGVAAYSVELVGIGILREFGPVIAAILFAGRSASAFTAQLGSMRMNKEIDAMRVMGVDVFDALVVPRVLAALLMLPLMTLIADLGGLVGGMLVARAMMGIEPSFFFQRLVDSVGAQQFWVGMAKVPLFALVIATTGCRQGLEVKDDVESLGAKVTGSVVQSIFMIIMFDALFAVLFKQAGL
ncbi:ABC transporter permease [Sphingobium sp.]|uniref:MlaE family ABC transporter permease n=1 Tax=Sphingobium sp. TaxID=1912891 RepID=UPI0025F27286|nr:ABC transporter permease [Sphingobium sp.]